MEWSPLYLIENLASAVKCSSTLSVVCNFGCSLRRADQFPFDRKLHAARRFLCCGERCLFDCRDHAENKSPRHSTSPSRQWVEFVLFDLRGAVRARQMISRLHTTLLCFVYRCLGTLCNASLICTSSSV
jgi:hypothetical protein